MRRRSGGCRYLRNDISQQRLGSGGFFRDRGQLGLLRKMWSF
jgi:hypothetical protein